MFTFCPECHVGLHPKNRGSATSCPPNHTEQRSTVLQAPAFLPCMQATPCHSPASFPIAITFNSCQILPFCPFLPFPPYSTSQVPVVKPSHSRGCFVLSFTVTSLYPAMYSAALTCSLGHTGPGLRASAFRRRPKSQGFGHV